MGKTDDDDTVYCDVQMPLAQGRELLQLVSTLRESNAHPALNRALSACNTSSVPQSISLRTRRPGARGASKSSFVGHLYFVVLKGC